MYNRRCFNDGYYIVHHLKRARHWTKMPADFVANRAEYVSQATIVFEGVDVFTIWVFSCSNDTTGSRRASLKLGDPRQSLHEIGQFRSRTGRSLPAADVVWTVNGHESCEV